METLKTFRHEYKYVISYEEMLKLREKLDKLLTIDRNNSYIVRSLYFDSYNDKDYYDKLNGELNRKKIRIRIYDINSDKAKLEIKAKYDYHQLKESLVINKKEANEIIKGNYDFLLAYNNETANKIYLILKEGYQPKVIIEYDRLAYITSTTTRITFDYNIKKSTDFDKFFTNDINYINLSDSKDIVLEVKFDRFLEPYISKVLEKYISRNQSVSKYMMGRNI